MIEAPPKELSVAIIKQRVKKYYENHGLIGKIMMAAKIKPALIITPQFSFLNERYLNNAYEALIQESPSTALISARSDAMIRTPEPEFGQLENLDFQVLVYPYDDQKFFGLDLLINFGGADPVEIARDMNNVKNSGYVIRMRNSNKNYVIQKIVKRIEGKDVSLLTAGKLVEHRHKDMFDLYKMTFS